MTNPPLAYKLAVRGWKYRDIAEMCGYANASSACKAVYSHAATNRLELPRRWSEQAKRPESTTRKRYTDLRSQGLTYQQIADKCGVSHQAVHQILTQSYWRRNPLRHIPAVTEPV